MDESEVVGNLDIGFLDWREIPRLAIPLNALSPDASGDRLPQRNKAGRDLLEHFMTFCMPKNSDLLRDRNLGNERCAPLDAIV